MSKNITWTLWHRRGLNVAWRPAGTGGSRAELHKLAESQGSKGGWWKITPPGYPKPRGSNGAFVVTAEQGGSHEPDLFANRL